MKGYDIQMFTRVHLVSSVLTPNHNVVYSPTRDIDSKIINTNNIIEITLESNHPKMFDREYEKKYEKIFDKPFSEMAIFNIKYCDGSNNLIIAPKDKYVNIK